MKKYFNVNFEFNHKELERIILETARESKGYCCFVDSTSLTISYKDENFRRVLNESLVNSCDGSYIAMLASKIHKEKLKEYIGPDFFAKFVYRSSKQIIIGSSENVYNKIIEKVLQNGADSANYKYISLPFVNVEDFKYQEIAEIINSFEPELIWVSLGAPKQEIFMNNLEFYLNKGVMIGVGAAFNYFTGEIEDIPNWARKSHLIWFYRILTEPKKQLKRCAKIIEVLPRMYFEEKKKVCK
jgi:N-acetylglucosaminyldiphosphoundecaprenol N-acetyl-beta-D-mannosaminyltransferase